MRKSRAKTTTIVYFYCAQCLCPLRAEDIVIPLIPLIPVAKVRFKRLDLRFLEIGVYCMLYLLKEILNFQESQVKSFETHFNLVLCAHQIHHVEGGV
eukprot:sb/3479035/